MEPPLPRTPNEIPIVTAKVIVRIVLTTIQPTIPSEHTGALTT
jgi:hypothetical protein